MKVTPLQFVVPPQIVSEEPVSLDAAQYTSVVGEDLGVNLLFEIKPFVIEEISRVSAVFPALLMKILSFTTKVVIV